MIFTSKKCFKDLVYKSFETISQILLKYQNLENHCSNNSNRKEVVYTVCNHRNPYKTKVKAKICKLQIDCDNDSNSLPSKKLKWKSSDSLSENLINLQNINSNYKLDLEENFKKKLVNYDVGIEENKIPNNFTETILQNTVSSSNKIYKQKATKREKEFDTDSNIKTNVKNKSMSNNYAVSSPKIPTKQTSEAERLNYHNRPNNKSVRVPEKKYPKMETILDAAFSRQEKKSETPLLEEVLKKYKSGYDSIEKSIKTPPMPISRNKKVCDNPASQNENLSNRSINLPEKFLNSNESMLNVTLKNESSENVYIILDSNVDVNMDMNEIKPGETFNRLETVSVQDLKELSTVNGKIVDFFLRNETKENIGVMLDTHVKADVEMMSLR